ncbi:VOC family protein [Pelagicoccus mobilis]|nr:VOC family protein [Pelagicoccus mobilis]
MLSAPVGSEFESSGNEPTRPSQRLHLILLGVENVQRSAQFYEELGWKRAESSDEGFVKFDLGGYALALISREDFAKDSLYSSSVGTGFSGVGLIYLARSAEEVPRILAKAVDAGGVLVKSATRTHWGVAGYFKDPDGHLFEVDYEETWIFDEGHRLVVDPTEDSPENK